jgi:hypothetical protein
VIFSSSSDRAPIGRVLILSWCLSPTDTVSTVVVIDATTVYSDDPPTFPSPLVVPQLVGLLMLAQLPLLYLITSVKVVEGGKPDTSTSSNANKEEESGEEIALSLAWTATPSLTDPSSCW